MRYWDTGDEATNSNLAQLERAGESWPGLTVDDFMNKILSVIDVRKVLPAAVLRHFNFPSLLIGNTASSWSKQRLADETAKLCGAINEGLDRVAADPTLQRGGGADLSDRPQTVGERVLAALKAFEKERGHAEFTKLRMAAMMTPLQRYVEKLDQALQQKGTRGNLSPEQTVLRAIGELEWYAHRCHHEKAG